MSGQRGLSNSIVSIEKERRLAEDILLDVITIISDMISNPSMKQLSPTVGIKRRSELNRLIWPMKHGKNLLNSPQPLIAPCREDNDVLPGLLLGSSKVLAGKKLKAPEFGF